MSPLIVSLDGNIGCGKSSIMHYLEKNFTNFCASNGNT
jgi:dephospho-CoA kinase